MIKLNRIGNKLGLAGAVGILLAIGMAANQMIAESSITGSTDRATRSQRVADAALTAHLDLRKMQLVARDIRLVRTAAEVEKSTADLQRLKVAGVKALDDALAAAERPEVRERLQNTRSLLDRYTAGVEELAKAQNTCSRKPTSARRFQPSGPRRSKPNWRRRCWPSSTTGPRSKSCCIGPTPR